MTAIELRIFRSCTRSAERPDAPRSPSSAFLFIRSKRRLRSFFSGAETPPNTGGKPTYIARPTKNYLRGRHSLLPVGLSPLAGLHHKANNDRSMLRFWG